MQKVEMRGGRQVGAPRSGARTLLPSRSLWWSSPPAWFSLSLSLSGCVFRTEFVTARQFNCLQKSKELSAGQNRTVPLCHDLFGRLGFTLHFWVCPFFDIVMNFLILDWQRRNMPDPFFIMFFFVRTLCAKTVMPINFFFF